MSVPFYKTKKFEALNKQWYKKLAKTGFDDVEQDEFNLKIWSSRFRTKQSMDSQHSKQLYYYMATQFLNDYAFKNEIERTIWEYHTEGIGYRNIAKTLNKAKVKSEFVLNRDSVNTVIARLQKVMREMYRGLREEYDPEF